MELFRCTEKKHRCHRAAKRETFDTYLVRLHIRQGLQVFRPGDEICDRDIREILVNQIRTGTAIVPKNR